MAREWQATGGEESGGAEECVWAACWAVCSGRRGRLECRLHAGYMLGCVHAERHEE